MRLFVALLLEPALERACVALQRQLASFDAPGNVRWANANAMHLTLQFLGEVGDATLADLEASLDAGLVGCSAPMLGVGGIGAFPSARWARVLWVGLHDESHTLATLEQAVTHSTQRLGFRREQRAFSPHVTLGRVQNDASGRTCSLAPRLVAALEHGPQPTDASAQLHRRIALMQSLLKPSGAEYRERRVWLLDPPGH